jgi:ATP-dependent DNA helicase DinG
VSNVPVVPDIGLSESVSKAFAKDGSLSRTIESFEPRPGQKEMATASADIFKDGGLLLAEAGTGTGKTVAYLVPAILSRRRVLVSTGTKNLQDQIFYKDLPALREALNVPFSATYMKGRSNYLCLHRFKAIQQESESRPTVDNAYLETLQEWATQTETGDRAEIEDLPDDLPLWHEISASSENCIGSECPQHQDCFVTRMRQCAVESDLVIVNHHLLCADAAVRQSAYGEVIPSCAYVVIDEAHQLEDVATQYFGISISNYRLNEFARDARHVISLEQLADIETIDEILRSVDRFTEQVKTFFEILTAIGVGGGRKRVTGDQLEPAAGSARQLILDLDQLVKEFSQLDNESEDVLALIRRGQETQDQLKFLLEVNDPNFVHFLELRGNGVFLRAAPIDVSDIIRERLLQRAQGTILTSATLTVDNSFDYFRGRLGIDKAIELRLPSEFNFKTQAIFYLPSQIPDPRSQEFSNAVAQELTSLLTITKGRAFALFTSYSNLRKVHQQLEKMISYPLLVQGTAPRTVLLREFRATPQAVLLATSSFWQGVDVAGDALSCVVIDKLPFASPNDPITAARMEAIEARGGNAFTDYQVPLAILTLLQGLGRLIRHRSDRGVLALLDGRVRTKGYGQRFLASLPPAPITHELEKVRQFIETPDQEIDNHKV